LAAAESLVSSYVSISVLTAELNLDDIIAGKFDLDVVGHYARDDIFKLIVKQPEV